MRLSTKAFPETIVCDRGFLLQDRCLVADRGNLHVVLEADTLGSGPSPFVFLREEVRPLLVVIQIIGRVALEVVDALRS